MNNNQEELVEVYNKGYFFLKNKIKSMGKSDDEATALIKTYVNGYAKCNSINDVYLRIAESAQNANMKKNVIGGAIGGVEKLREVLYDFDPKITKRCYSSADHLLSVIEEKLGLHGKIRKAPGSLWPKFARTLIEGAGFLSRFENGDEFMQWAGWFYNDERSKPALPLLLSAEIYGFGYALACDFLKEIGFVNYGKPDVHIIDIFAGVGLCEKEDTPYHIQKIICDIAAANSSNKKEVTPYAVDKIFWLIGGGNFYLNSEIGNKGNIGRCKAEFIADFNSIHD